MFNRNCNQESKWWFFLLVLRFWSKRPKSDFHAWTESHSSARVSQVRTIRTQSGPSNPATKFCCCCCCFKGSKSKPLEGTCSFWIGLADCHDVCTYYSVCVCIVYPLSVYCFKVQVPSTIHFQGAPGFEPTTLGGNLFSTIIICSWIVATTKCNRHFKTLVFCIENFYINEVCIDNIYIGNIYISNIYIIKI